MEGFIPHRENNTGVSSMLYYFIIIRRHATGQINSAFIFRKKTRHGLLPVIGHVSRLSGLQYFHNYIFSALTAFLQQVMSVRCCTSMCCFLSAAETRTSVISATCASFSVRVIPTGDFTPCSRSTRCRQRCRTKRARLKKSYFWRRNDISCVMTDASMVP